MYSKLAALTLGIVIARLILRIVLVQPYFLKDAEGDPEAYLKLRGTMPLEIKSTALRRSGLRVLCYINTFFKNHETKAAHVKNTWARRCSNHFFTSATDNPSLRILRINMSVPETHMHLWVKMRAVLRAIYNLSDQYDYFYKADDDTYAIYDNLEFNIQRYSPLDPFMTGWRWNTLVDGGYFSGGSGYVLSQEALKRIVGLAIDRHPNCPRTDEDKEDVKMSMCGQAVGVKLYETLGCDGKSLFYPFLLNKYAANLVQKAYKEKKCIDRGHISFHYIRGYFMYILEFFLYYLRPVGH